MFSEVTDLTLSDDGFAAAPAAAPGAPLARHELRDWAWALFEPEKARLMTGLGGVVSAEQIELLRPYQLEFNKRAKRRLGACHYDRKRISLSLYLIRKGLSLRQMITTIRHELAHAAMPNEHHSAKWAAFCLAIGGDGKRCAEGLSEMIDHEVEVFCPVGGQDPGSGHYFAKQLVKPNRNFLERNVCSKCKTEGKLTRIIYKRVPK